MLLFLVWLIRAWNSKLWDPYIFYQTLNMLVSFCTGIYRYLLLVCMWPLAAILVVKKKSISPRWKLTSNVRYIYPDRDFASWSDNAQKYTSLIAIIYIQKSAPAEVYKAMQFWLPPGKSPQSYWPGKVTQFHKNACSKF